METYTQRAIQFFFQSIRNLKKESSGQRWNEICEDATILFETEFPSSLGKNPMSHEEIWQLLFDPPQESTIVTQKFESLCQQEVFIDFFFYILQSLLDPPYNWWKSSYLKCTNLIQ